ncbi:acetyl-CoA C-acetyltransferase [Lentisphaerota bacterium ZTH]|nr:acetyl-CoA C-acetyltransferase [Lentisphaerota bacterium]WET05916.1 acetyl-CoA C-acetyltransferase [Lentisphaerota bacterium ZTH]
MSEVFIIAALRTPVGAFNGALSNVSAVKLGAASIEGLLEKTKLSPDKVDEVIIGQVLTAGCGQNPARQTSIEAGIPETVPAMTINKVCGSGLKAVQLAAQAISCGEAGIVIAGGQENMSQAPHILNNSRNGARIGDWPLVDSMIKDGLWEAFNNYHMGQTAENVAELYGITREEQDEFAANSQQKAGKARAEGKFAEEIVTVKVPQRKSDPVLFADDEFIRPDTTAEKLSKLRPAFSKTGSVTAGNASGINDGAAMVLLASKEKVEELGLVPLARIVSYANVGLDPKIMGIGPAPASKAALAKAGWDISELDLIEANEAFAAQAIAVNREMGWPVEKVNVNGGSIAIGHPIGASGCRILVTLLHEMVKRDASKGIAALCIGGGMGTALTVER